MTDKFTGLEWIRIFDPIHIPKYLIEQIKERDFSTDRFIDYQKVMCVNTHGDRIEINPYNLLYVVADERKHVVGFLWCVVEILSGVLIINNFSMDKSYWCKGKAVEFLKNQVEDILKKSKLKRAYWCTRHTKYMEKYGFTRSNNILMEYSHGINTDGHAYKASGNDESAHTGTAELSESSPRVVDTASGELSTEPASTLQ